MTDINDQPADESVDDMWAAAMSESASNTAAAQDGKPAGGSEVFKPLTQEHAVGDASARDISMIMDIPVTLTVELGRTRLSIKELLAMTQGQVINLDGAAGEPMSIFINDHLVANGEVVVLESRYGIRITDIVTPSERIKKLSKR
jgi:flagellar motor switch protein FliN/FliY